MPIQIVHCCGTTNGLRAVRSVIKSMNSDNMKIKACEEILKEVYEYDISIYEEQPNIKSKIEMEYNKQLLAIIPYLKDTDLIGEKLIEFGILEKFLEYGYDVKNKSNIIQNNIEKILEYYGIENIAEKKEMLLRMKESNSKVFEQMDYRLLDDEFLSAFSEEEINLIINTNRVIVEEICSYNEKELEFISCIISNLENKDDFNEYFEQTFININSYKELIENVDIKDLDEEQIQNLKIIIQNKNIFDIKTIDDLNNFENIKKQRLQEIMDTEVKELKGDIIKEKKNALLIKMFGIDYDAARSFVIEFGELASNDKNLQMMKNIISLDETNPTGMYETDKLLREMFKDERIQQQECPLLDKIEARKKYINQYEQMYNDVLFKPEDGKFIQEKDGIKFYDAGTDFSILSTSIGAYSGTSDRAETKVDEKEMWNRKDLSSNHFCGSFSRDDMIGIIQTNLGLYYGFSKIVPNSLLYMSAEDNQSRSNSFTSSINGIRPFKNPDNMIEHTGSDEYCRRDFYNEFDIKREIDGIRKAPDYIIAIKVDGKVVNEKQAIEAAKQWDCEKPIVIVDVDKCLEKSMENLDKDIQGYEENPTNENLKKVWNTFHKTSITYGAFYKLNNREEHKDFLEMVNLPKVLKDNIDNDKIKTGYYFLKDKNIFKQEKTLTQERKTLQIKDLMDSMYGSKVTIQQEKSLDISDDEIDISEESIEDVEFVETVEIKEESTTADLTFEEVGKETISSFKENPNKEMTISQTIENGAKKIVDRFSTR